MGRAALILIGLSVGVLAGIGAFALLEEEQDPLVSAARPVESEFPSVDHDPAAASELVAAWERWRTATFSARGTWERRLDEGGTPLRGVVETVQDPPRRTVVRLGTLVESVDGTMRSCDTELENLAAPPCAEGEGSIGYDQRVALELELVESYVTGDDRPFDVGPGVRTGCYRVENRAFLATAPWGLWAEFCFDADTGAMQSARVRRSSAVDVEIMFEIRSDVTTADFVLG